MFCVQAIINMLYIKSTMFHDVICTYDPHDIMVRYQCSVSRLLYTCCILNPKCSMMLYFLFNICCNIDRTFVMHWVICNWLCWITKVCKIIDKSAVALMIGHCISNIYQQDRVTSPSFLDHDWSEDNWNWVILGHFGSL